MNQDLNVLKSDYLPLFHKFIKEIKVSPNLVKAVRCFSLIIDANIVIEDIRFLCIHREKNYRRAVQEISESGTARFYAPTWLETEVIAKSAKICAEINISEEVYINIWYEYKKHIVFREETPSYLPDDVKSIDEKDVPYVELYYHADADAVVSKDKHISMMGAHQVTPEFLIDLRNYARSKSVELGIIHHGIYTTSIAVEAFKGAGNLAILLGKRFSRLNPWIQAAIIFGGIALVAHPKSRNFISEKMKEVFELSKPLATEIGLKLGELMEFYEDERQNAEQQLSKLEDQI